MANVQMTKVQMWNRYKALKKKDYNWTCICPVCSKQIYEKDPDIEYVKTKRGTEIFIHTQCIKEWDKYRYCKNYTDCGNKTGQNENLYTGSEPGCRCLEDELS